MDRGREVGKAHEDIVIGRGVPEGWTGSEKGRQVRWRDEPLLL